MNMQPGEKDVKQQGALEDSSVFVVVVEVDAQQEIL